MGSAAKELVELARRIKSGQATEQERRRFLELLKPCDAELKSAIIKGEG